MSQEVKPQTVDEDFSIVLASEADVLKFALQLAAPCNHCSMKANIALLSSKLLCSEAFAQTQDARYIDERVILSSTIMVLEGLDESEAEEMQAIGARAAGSHLN